MNDVTRNEYNNLAHAYDYLNEQLFGSALPDCLITLKRDRPGHLGHYQSMVVRSRTDQKATDEISLNIASFPSRTDTDILSTLAHEMVHLWQAHYGNKPRKAYHDKQFARKMKEIGLFPSDTGEPGGKETGQRMAHYIMEGHLFDTSVKELISSGYKINWQMELEQPEEKEKKKSKVKYTCLECEQNAWAKPESKLICGDCMEVMESEDNQESADD